LTGCNADRCDPPAPIAIPARYRPQLVAAPMTQAAGRLVATQSGLLGTLAGPFTSAAAVLDWGMDEVFPQVVLDSVLDTRKARWHAQRDLLNSAGDSTDFVAEIDDDGRAQLRFGDDEHGQRPDSATAFAATYRIGNGAAGNVGADSIVHIVGQPGDIAQVLSLRNPMPAAGGVDPESADSVRRNAPQAFRTQERAVTTDDYAAVVERDPQVQRAAATLRWTGSWYTVFITPDPLAGADPAQLEADLPPLVERYRMAGHDLEFNEPRYVSLEIALHVCVKDDYFRSDVRQSLLQLFSNRVLADGSRGLFHPDNFSFGQTVYLSPLYAAAHKVPGVASVQVTTFQRQGTNDPSYLLGGELPLDRLEIARLDNDPNFPEHGVLRLGLDGGK
jgi:predicted phage baseplate assembly protein